MIITTAGYVDYGAISLLQTISEINADRLPEKRRSMSINLGYAYWP